MHAANHPEMHHWQLGPSRFSACVEKGARLMRWSLELGGNRSREVLYWPDELDWSAPEKIRGGNPILFPFLARSFDKGQPECWRNPEGEQLPMPRHGFCRQGRFELESLREDGFTALFIPDAKAKACYPYPYSFKVIYDFDALGFTVTLRLENHGDTPIPWSAGHHFYFKVPWHPELSHRDYTIEIPAKKHFRAQSDGGLASVSELPESLDCAEEALVDLFHCKLQGKFARLGPKNGEENICVEIGEDSRPPTWTSFTTWTESKTSPFYCLEPWMGLPNAAEHQKGLHFVPPQSHESFKVKVRLE